VIVAMLDDCDGYPNCCRFSYVLCDDRDAKVQFSFSTIPLYRRVKLKDFDLRCNAFNEIDEGTPLDSRAGSTECWRLCRILSESLFPSPISSRALRAST
jgi:hypothetical protein